QHANAASQRGDTAQARAIQLAFYKKWGIEPPDQGISPAEIEAKCGKVPVPPQSLVMRDRLQARIDTLRVQQRDAASAAQEKARDTSGMPNDEFFTMSERLERWYAIAVKGEKGGAARFWTDDEGALFEARRARIKRIFEQQRRG